jgi:hypothetical protein
MSDFVPDRLPLFTRLPPPAILHHSTQSTHSEHPRNSLQFAFTLVTFAAIAFIAVNVLNLDVDEILDAAKNPTKK